MKPLVSSSIAKDFLSAVASLPPVRERVLYRSKSKALTEREWAALSPAERAGLERTVIDDEHYYEGGVADPLHYVRPLDLAATHGTSLSARAKVFDFGYGGVGHLRAMASLGLSITGVEVRAELRALYSAPEDTGRVASTLGRGDGELRLLDGFFPTDPKIKAAVGSGYQLIVAKNTLKKGYIHPDRPAPPEWLIHLGVDDVTFLAAFHDAVAPGGRVMVYNLFIPIPDDQPFKPMSDGRSPFTKEQWGAAGFEVESFDVDDTAGIQALLEKQAVDSEEDRAERAKIRALYTLVRSPP